MNSNKSSLFIYTIGVRLYIFSVSLVKLENFDLG